MSQDTGSAQAEILLENDEYRRLDAQHHEYEHRLADLTSKVVLSDDEQFEEVTLKKKKLQVKDRMQAIAREFRAAHP